MVRAFFVSQIIMIIKKIRSILSSLKRKVKADDKFLKDISGVIHIGANYGQEKGSYRNNDLDVVWVEPIPEIFSELEKGLKNYPKQKAYQELVTDVDGKEYDFKVANNKGASSSILDLKEHKDMWPDIKYEKSLKIKSTTLSTLVTKYNIDLDKYQALIMDTQGSELLVLAGALPILNQFKYIKTEVSDFEAYANCCQLKDVDAFMKTHGFQELSKRKFATREAGGSYYDVIYHKEA